MTRAMIALAGLGGAIILLALVAGMLGLVHIDWFPSMGAYGVYGVDIGTNTHYCSLELVRLQLGVSCEAAQ